MNTNKITNSTSVTNTKQKTRNFTGCWACRYKKRKCDETRPICSLCVKHNDSCEYDVKLIWSNYNLYTVNEQDKLCTIHNNTHSTITIVPQANKQNFGDNNTTFKNNNNNNSKCKKIQSSNSYTISDRRYKVYKNQQNSLIHGAKCKSDNGNAYQACVNEKMNFLLQELESQIVSAKHIVSNTNTTFFQCGPFGCFPVSGRNKTVKGKDVATLLAVPPSPIKSFTVLNNDKKLISDTPVSVESYYMSQNEYQYLVIKSPCSTSSLVDEPATNNFSGTPSSFHLQETALLSPDFDAFWDSNVLLNSPCLETYPESSNAVKNINVVHNNNLFCDFNGKNDFFDLAFFPELFNADDKYYIEIFFEFKWEQKVSPLFPNKLLEANFISLLNDLYLQPSNVYYQDLIDLLKNEAVFENLLTSNLIKLRLLSFNTTKNKNGWLVDTINIIFLIKIGQSDSNTNGTLNNYLFKWLKDFSLNWSFYFGSDVFINSSINLSIFLPLIEFATKDTSIEITKYLLYHEIICKLKHSMNHLFELNDNEKDGNFDTWLLNLKNTIEFKIINRLEDNFINPNNI
ncbi:Thi2p SCDLUD_001030 [Saccharomycodes ludwigii]|uniref:Thi2p n=1 Tax=Saccharomycodes ludwigii TaxID=36035 RepID=UPI001E85DF14|nr:hypothetical protein SCDLUD_001030 [Saccharomycodes ludwigii]KAH3903395.1 hypothetical protein SCDLUD_001030 [Saccharomycodes ludwigii]